MFDLGADIAGGGPGHIVDQQSRLPNINIHVGKFLLAKSNLHERYTACGLEGID